MIAPIRWFWVIAGPNGAGKSTLAARDFAHLPLINPDIEAQKLSPERPGDAAAAGGRAAYAAIRRALQHAESFAVETTLAGRSHLRLMAQAQADGWRLGLAYVGIDSADVALLRVMERYLLGGHNVPPEDVRRRYRRSVTNLAAAARLAHAGVVYDNGTRHGPRRVIELRERRIIGVAPPVPAWLGSAFAPTKIAVGAVIA